MSAIAGSLLALALLGEPSGDVPSNVTDGAAPAVEQSDEESDPYAVTTGGLLLGWGQEKVTGSPAAEVRAVKLVIDSVHRVQPYAFRGSAQISEEELSAEVGGKLLAPALGPVRAYAAVCAGGALRSAGSMVTLSGAVGLDLRLGSRLVFTAEAEGRYEAGADPEASLPGVARYALLAGVGVPF